ncbi:hypothetical protein ACHAWU_008380 [Discostella pseudostelligera]|uniref:CWF21 domain-containing protein n=1 Tax=Discostella pseudostelligera TaxID=259834 RepID=A0ABD3M3Q4_9STRA
MYNGIGLASVRGTATSGHVQFNAGHVRNSSSWQRTWRNANAGNGNGTVGGGGGGRGESSRNKLLTDEAIKEGASSLALHEKKRQLEVRLLELRDQLEEEGRMNDADIDNEIEWERKQTLDRWAKEEKDRRVRLLKQQQIQQGDAIEGGGEEGGIKLITKDGEQEKESDELVGVAGNDECKSEGKHEENSNDNGQLPPPRQRRWDNPPPSDRMGRRDNNSRNYNRERGAPQRGGGVGRGRGGTNAQAQQLLQQQRNDRLRDAFGISDATHKEGEAFNRELQHAKKVEKQKENELQEKAARKLERQRIREERRNAKKAKHEGKGRVDDNNGDEGRRKKKRDTKKTRRRRSPSTSSGSESSSSFSSSSSSGSFSSRSSASYSSTSSYSSASRRGRERKFSRGRERGRRGRRSYSSSPSRSRSVSSGDSNSSRSRSGTRNAKHRSKKDANPRRHRSRSNGSISVDPPSKKQSKMREEEASRSSSPKSRSNNRDKKHPTMNDEISEDQTSKSPPPIGERKSEPVSEGRFDSRPTSPGAPSPPVPSSHGGNSSNDDEKVVGDDEGKDFKSEEAPRNSRRSRWGDRPVSEKQGKSPSPLAPSTSEGKETAEGRTNHSPSPPPREAKESSQTSSRRDRKSSASRSSGPAQEGER